MSTTAVRISPAWEDPDAVVATVRSAGPFWSLANYAANDAEMAALGSRQATFTPPWFRQDFALLRLPRSPGRTPVVPEIADFSGICGTTAGQFPTCSRSLCFMTFPVALRGRSVTNHRRRGRL